MRFVTSVAVGGADVTKCPYAVRFVTSVAVGGADVTKCPYVVRFVTRAPPRTVPGRRATG